jgi:multiple sugar transport system substrate-binding protein
MEPRSLGVGARTGTTRRELLRQAGAAGVALAGTSVLAACGGGGGDETADGKVTLQFWDEVWGGDQYQPTVDKLLAEFQKANPDIAVEYRSVPWANFYEVYNTAIASGTTPDVAVAPTFPWKGSLASLDEVVAQWKENGIYDDVITETIESQRDAEGLLTGVPWSIELRVITYRKDMFEKAGLDVPTTLEEIGQAARALSKDGKYGLGFTGETLGSQMLYSFFLNNGGGLFDESGCQAAMTSDRNAEVCEWIQAMVRDGAIPKAAAGWTPDELASAMNNGNIAMAHNSPGWYAQLNTEVSEQADIMPPPAGFHGDKGTIIYHQPVWMYQASEHKAEAQTFIDWWLDNLPELFRNGQMTSLPARRSFYEEVEVYRDPRMQTVLEEWVPVGKTIAGDCNAELLYVLSKVEGQGFLQTLTQDILTMKPIDKSLQTAQDALSEVLATNA